MARPRLLGALGIIALLGCQQEQVSKSQYEAKVREADSLRGALDELLRPERLLARAKADFASDRATEARAAAAELVNRHPAAAEAAEARAFISRIDGAEKQREAAAQRQREHAIASMVKKRDDMRNLTVWCDRAMPQYVNSRSGVAAYVVSPDGGRPHLRFVAYYVADDWLFIQKYLFKIDGRAYTLTPSSYGSDAVQRDNGEGGIWEWWDIPAEGDALAVLQALADAREATMRYEGQQYYKDRAIGPDERAAVRRTLQALSTLAAQ